MLCFTRNFQPSLPSCAHSCAKTGAGRESYAILARDGREVIVDSRMELLGGETVLEVNRDVTTAAIFRAMFDQSGIFAGIMDLGGYLREANKLSLEWCGYTREQVLDRPFWDTPWWRGSESMKAKIHLATEQATAGHIFREELRNWLADGSERIVDFTMHPIRGPIRRSGVSTSYRHRYYRAQAGRS
jgi:PAS domain S-box-containing protein